MAAGGGQRPAGRHKVSTALVRAAAAAAAAAPHLAARHASARCLHNRNAGPVTAPSLSDADDSLPSTSGRPPAPQAPPPGPGPLRQAYKRLLRSLASLKLAIAELAVIGALSAVGTIIKQGEPYAYYAEVGATAAAAARGDASCVCWAGPRSRARLHALVSLSYTCSAAHELLSLTHAACLCVKRSRIPCPPAPIAELP